MKKVIAWVLAMVLALSMTIVFAEGNTPAEETEAFFARLENIEWSFSSGAGAWSTDMRILPDGSFSGEYHDSEMGETGEGYPEGTVYCCSFTGKLSLVEQVNENTWKIRVDELKTDESQAKELIEDGLRYVYTEPYGISAGDEMLLYQPGTPVDGFTEEMKVWAHLMEIEPEPSELPAWFLSSEKNDSGFVGEAAPVGMMLPNPWQDLTAEQLQEKSGFSFAVPEEAEKVIYRWLEDGKMAEIQFSIGKDDFCARIQPAALAEGEAMPDISGMYFAWENEREINVGGFAGIFGQAKTGSEDWVERCLWYDADNGNMCSLSVGTTNPDGLDLEAMAAQIFLNAAK